MKIYIFHILLLTCALVDASPLRERIYVQTDKRLYLAGEPILMKFVTTDSELIPLDFSKVAYANLVRDSVALLQIMVELTDGVGSGRMFLPVDIPAGNYRLIAYTRFMRNEGTAVFFEKNIAVVNTFLSGYNPSEARPETTRHLSPAAVTSFVDNVETGISMQTDKTVYTPRSQGKLVISGLPENIHTLSVAIAGMDFVPATESEASLFSRNKKIESTEFTGEFIPEYEGHIVTGNITGNQTGEVIESRVIFPEAETDTGGSQSVFSSAMAFTGGNGIRFFAGRTNETGNAMFFTSGVSGTREAATVVYNADENYRIDILSPFVSRFTPKQMPLLHIDSVYYNQLLARSVALQMFRIFSEDNKTNQDISEPHIQFEPSRRYHLDDYFRFPTMREVFIEFIVGARFRRNDGKRELSVLTNRSRGANLEWGTMPLVLLDGVPITDHEAIFDYDPLTVETINLYFGPFILGGFHFDGIIELITYRRLHQNLILNRASQVIGYEGPQMPHRFDAPDYSQETDSQNRTFDARHTLLWNPSVITDGKDSITLLFDTSNLTGEFQATVEGIATDGKFIYATAIFKVEK